MPDYRAINSMRSAQAVYDSMQPPEYWEDGDDEEHGACCRCPDCEEQPILREG